LDGFTPQVWYLLQDALPEQMKGSLPTIEELEDVLEAVPTVQRRE
jgi:hypothetical protein